MWCFGCFLRSKENNMYSHHESPGGPTSEDKGTKDLNEKKSVMEGESGKSGIKDINGKIGIMEEERGNNGIKDLNEKINVMEGERGKNGIKDLNEKKGVMDGERGKSGIKIDQPTGKSCYMLSPRDLSITWGNDNRYWQWINDSSFGELAKLSSVCWFEVRGDFDGKCLTPGSAYTVSFILKLQNPYGWDNHPVKFEASTSGGYHQVSARFLQNLEKPVVDYQMASFRHLADGWIEFDAGEFVVENNEGSSKKVSFCMRNWEGGNWKGGLLLRGVKIQPRVKSIGSG